MDDLQLVNRLLEALEAARRAVLCAVIASEGSAPRGAGALMAVFGENDACGTVGGGAVERMAQAKAASMLGQTAGMVEHYTMSGADSTTGMICGGAVSIAFVPLGAADIPALRRWQTLLSEEKSGWLTLDCRAGTPRLNICESDGAVQPDTCEPIFRDGIYTQPIGQDGTLYLFGGGHVGQHRFYGASASASPYSTAAVSCWTRRALPVCAACAARSNESRTMCPSRRRIMSSS